MFCDEVSVTVRAGRGGNGAISFRRVKYNAKGGPDGGNGGKGGDIVFQASSHLNTLSDFLNNKNLSAESGVAGGKNNRAGRYGEDLVVKVPLGTKVTNAETGDLLFDLTDPQIQAVVAHGGRGGYGNAHFTSSTRQAPRFAEKGEPGEEFELNLELQMIADVALVGLPSAGKSTLISVLSAARPKIGAYPFTTLVPNLGVVKMKEFGGSAEQDFVIADVPGLIAGAHEGKGLGDRFLRHIKRTAVILHVVDLTLPDFIDSYQTINQELMLFDPRLLERKQLVVLNKIDTLTEADLAEKKAEFLAAYPFLEEQLLAVSGVSKAGLKELSFRAAELVGEVRNAEVEGDVKEARDTGEAVAYKVFRPSVIDPQQVEVKEVDSQKYLDEFTNEMVMRKRFRLTGKRLEQIVTMTDLANDEALARVYDVLQKKKVDLRLKKAGAKPGDRLLIGEIDLEWLG